MNRFLFRSVTALALSGLLLATAAGPASALVPPPATPAPPDPMDVVAPTQARASVDVRDIAAGTAAGVFTVTVTHPSPVPVLADPIDFVVVALPAGLVQAIGATGPAGWSGVVLDDGRTVEFSGGELPGAGTAPFVVTANVARPVAGSLAGAHVDRRREQPRHRVAGRRGCARHHGWRARPDRTARRR